MRKNIFKLVCILLLLSIGKIKADHIMGADISYRLLDPNIGKYRITLSLYQDCSGILYGGEQLQLIRSTGTTFHPLTLKYKEEVTPICLPPDIPAKPYTNCPGPNTPVGANGIKGVMKWVFEIDLNIGVNQSWAIVAWTSCCRNTPISTGASWQPIWVQAAINTNYINSSTVFTTPPIPYWCMLKKNTYNHGPIDTIDAKYITVNGQSVIRDSIGYEIICPFINRAASITQMANLDNPCVNFNPPLNKYVFLYTTNNSVQIDAQTGTISCIPSRTQDAVMAIAIREFRAVANPSGIGYTRQMIGYVCRDIQFTVREPCEDITTPGVIPDSLVNANYVAYDKVDICGSINSKVSFKIVGAPTQFIKSTVIQTPSSQAVFNFKYRQSILRAAQTDTLYGTITFDSTKGVGQEKFIIKVYYCTSIGTHTTAYYTLLLNFRPAVKVDKKFLYYCPGGKPVRSYARGGTKYVWSPKKNIVDSSGLNFSWVDLMPDSSRTYVVKAIDGIDSTKSCSIIDSVRVIVIPKFNYTLSPKVSDVCLHDTVQVILNTQISDTPYTYKWIDPTQGSMFNPTNNKKTSSVSSPRVIAISNGTYKVDIESRFNCILTDSIRVNIKGVRPNASGLSARKLICPGDTTLVSVNVIPKTSGPSLYTCVSSPQQITVTQGAPQSYPTACNPSNPATCYPNPYSTVGVGQSSSTRIIYKKSELVAAGLKPGIIKSIAFNISNVLNGTIENFEVRMGTTTSTNATTVNVPMFTIYGPTTTTITAGWNNSTKYDITRGFDWDGNSNIIIETHASNSSPMLTSNQMLTMTSAAGNEVAFKVSDTVGLSAENASKSYTGAGATASKPQLRIEYCMIDSTQTSTLNTTWSPSNLITALPNPRAIARVTQKDSLFTATVGTSQCFDTAVVKIKIDTTFKVKINPGKRIYCITGSSSPNVNLSSTVTGSASTVVNWTCITTPASGGGLPAATNTPNIVVTPSVGQWTYVVTATDAPCSASDTVTITVNNNIPLSFTIDSALCTSNTGKIKANLPSGTIASDFKFNWSGAPSPYIVGADTARDSLKNLPVGNYTLMIQLKTDATCQGTTSGIVAAKTITLGLSDTTSGIRCFGGTADSIWARVSSVQGSGNYKFTWSPGLSSDTFYKLTNKGFGTYNTTVTDRVTGCSGTTVYNHTQPTQLVISSVEIDHIKCKGDKTGRIKVNVSGGTLNGGSYIYQWTSVEKGQPMPNFNEIVQLLADSVRVTVTDMNGCTVSGGYRITEPLKGLTIDSIRVVNATTVGGNDGTATGYISGGTPTFKYKWENSLGALVKPINNVPNLSDVASGLSKGMYHLTVTDSGGCTAVDSVMVRDVVCNMKYIVSTDSVRCSDSLTGKIHFGAIDSINYATTTWYKYTLYQGVDISTPSLQNTTKNNSYFIDTAHFTGLGANIYTVRIQTNKGCDTFVNFILISQNPKFFTNATDTMPSCFGYNDGQVHVSVIGNFAPYTFDFNDGFGFQSDSFNKLQTSGLNKFVKVKDALGCIQTQGYKVDTPSSIQVLINPSLPITRCKSDSTDVPTEIVVSSSTPSILSTLSYMSKPGLDVDTTSRFMTKLTGGNKSFTVNYTNVGNGKRCPFPFNFVVQEPDTLVLTPMGQDPRCHNTADGIVTGKLKLSQGGNAPNGTTGYDYVLYKGGNLINSDNNSGLDTISFNNLDSGIYTLTVFDRKGCTNSQVVTLGKRDTFKVGFGNIADAPCIESPVGSITVNSYQGGNPTTNYIHRWFMYDLLSNTDNGELLNKYNNNPATGLRGLARYTVEVSDSKGCTATRSVIIDTQYVLRITSMTVDSATCFGGTNGKITINSVHPSLSDVTNFSYNGVSSTNPFTGSANTYNIVLTDKNGCVTTGSATIEQPSAIQVLGKVYDAKCYGESSGSIKIRISGGTPSYKTPIWNSGSDQQLTDSAMDLAAGKHIVVVIDAKNCVRRDTFTVLQPVPFIASIDKAKDITCFEANDGELSIKTEGGAPTFTYTWNNNLSNSPTQKNLKPSTYRVTVTDINGCTTSTNREITQPDKLEFDKLKVDSVSCPNYRDGVIDVSAKGGKTSNEKPYEYSIDGGTTFLSGNKFPELLSGDYNVVIRDNNGCIAARKVTVGEPEELYITAKKDSTKDTIKMGEQINLYYTQNTRSGKLPTINNINWSPSSALSCVDCPRPVASPYVTTLYEVEVRYHKNCIAKSKINVPVYDPMDFFVPSAFTPGNRDGLNDQLLLYANGVKKMKLQIFNRWGEKVFESDHLSKGWDGSYKSESQPSGIYSYFAEVEYLNGEKRTKKGSITLIK